MLPPSPLHIELFWHPGDEALARPLAEHVYKKLNHDPTDNTLPGLGIQLFFSNQLFPVRKHRPPERLLRLVLLGPKLILDETWRSSLASFSEEDSATDHTQVTVCVGLISRAVKGAKLGVDLSGEENAPRALVDLAVLQCCRLLSGRERDGTRGRGAAPLKLFISHTKRDDDGRDLALLVEESLKTLRTERFFDEYNLQPGDHLDDTLKDNIDDAVIVAIRTDQYMSSPWCRTEVAYAKKACRPIVVVDALRHFETRTSTLLALLPSFRLDPGAKDEARLAQFLSFTALEVLRFLYTQQLLNRMKKAAILPEPSKLLVRPPDMHDLASTGSQDMVLAYPDPALSPEETQHLQRPDLSILTLTDIWGKVCEGHSIGISVGSADKDELLSLGLSELHIKDAARVIARSLLSAGGNLVYGGALELKGPALKGENFVSALFQMIDTYNRRGSAEFPPLTNYSAWPFWEGIDDAWQIQHLDALRVKLLERPYGAEKYSDMSIKDILSDPLGRAYAGISLSEMRKVIASSVDARVFLGGATYDFLGLMPGLLEEACGALDNDCPLYILGGFGGAAGLLVDALEGETPQAFTEGGLSAKRPEYSAMLEAARALPNPPDVDFTSALAKLHNCGAEGIAKRNGLSVDQNRMLWSTNDLDVGVALMMEGMRKIFA